MNACPNGLFKVENIENRQELQVVLGGFRQYASPFHNSLQLAEVLNK